MKKQLIEKYLQEPLKNGDIIYVKGLGSQNKEAMFNTVPVEKVEGDMVFYQYHKLLESTHISNTKKYTGDIGANPFNDFLWRKVSNINYTLESILFQLGLIDEKREYKTNKGFIIKNANFNPFVEHNGKKEYYQRAFVWGLEDMQSLVASIYNRFDCGKIVVRNRSWEWLHARENEDECYWKDIVDGKQRLTTIHKFINNEFKDFQGNYFEDLSDIAQNKFLNHQLFSYSELSEDTTDEDVLKQFLAVNFCGVIQSKEHINYIEKLLK